MSVHAELCPAPVANALDARRTRCITSLYELRLHVLTLAQDLSMTHDLSAALQVTEAHASLLLAIDIMEKKHPELA